MKRWETEEGEIPETLEPASFMYQQKTRESVSYKEQVRALKPEVAFWFLNEKCGEHLYPQSNVHAFGHMSSHTHTTSVYTHIKPASTKI